VKAIQMQGGKMLIGKRRKDRRPHIGERAARLNRTNLHAVSISRLLSAILAVAVICSLLSKSGVGLGFPEDQSGRHISKSFTTGHETTQDGSGPTILMGYSKAGFKKNHMSSFLYFIPLISPTVVYREISANNEQQVGIISYEKQVDSESFTVVCEFEITGKGFHKYTFDTAGMVAEHRDELNNGESLKNMLDYIKYEGEGFGRIEVKGMMTGSTPRVTEVNMQFNARDRKSPVTVGLYDIELKDGKYKYENRSNQSVARVNALIFKKTDKTPRMGIKVASVSDSAEHEGFFSRIKGTFANLLITPPKVSQLGNETMMNFGYTLLEKKGAFTFPKATNIREDRLAVSDPAHK
jgi:hypothetical protein